MTTRRLAIVALFSLALFSALIAVLHVVRTDCDVLSRHLSEYVVGRFGWMMTLAFIASGVALVCVSIGLARSLAPSRMLAIGCRLLLVAGILNGMMAVFRTDLSIAEAGEPLVRTDSGRIHDALAALHA